MVAEIGGEEQAAQGIAPELKGRSAGCQCLTAQSQHALDQRPAAEFFQQAGLADAALAADQPESAAAVFRVGERLTQLAKLGIPPDETRRLQETLADGVAFFGHRDASRGAQVSDHGVGVLIAIQRVLRQQPGDDLGQRGGRGGVEQDDLAGHGGRHQREQRGEVRLGFQHAADQVAHGVGAERMLADQQLERHHADGVEVAGFGRRIALKHFGRHVRQRPGGSVAGDGQGFGQVERQAEIEDADVRLTVFQHHRDVIRLEVAVDHAATVQICQRLQGLQQQVDLDGERLIAPRLNGRAGRVQQVHRQKGLPVGVEAVIQHADHVGVAQRGEGLEFLRQREAAVGGVVEDAGGELKLIAGGEDALEGDFSSGEAIQRPVDRAHAAVTKLGF